MPIPVRDDEARRETSSRDAAAVPGCGDRLINSAGPLLVHLADGGLLWARLVWSLRFVCYRSGEELASKLKCKMIWLGTGWPFNSAGAKRHPFAA
jgi:hypothetical protein